MTLVKLIGYMLASHWKILGALALAAVLALALVTRGCERPSGVSNTLMDGERERLVVEGRKITRITPKGSEVTYIPKKATISVSDDGSVNLSIPKVGIDFELGGGLGGSKDGLKLMVDSRVYYLWRASLHVGITADPTIRIRDMFRPVVFGSYPLPLNTLPNTSIWLGHEVAGSIIGGVRVRF